MWGGVAAVTPASKQASRGGALTHFGEPVKPTTSVLLLQAAPVKTRKAQTINRHRYIERNSVLVRHWLEMLRPPSGRIR